MYLILIFQTVNKKTSEGYLKLIIESLNYISIQVDIKSYFEIFGPVSSYSLLTDKQTGKSWCFAFLWIKDSKLQKINIIKKTWNKW